VLAILLSFGYYGCWLYALSFCTNLGVLDQYLYLEVWVLRVFYEQFGIHSVIN